MTEKDDGVKARYSKLVVWLGFAVVVIGFGVIIYKPEVKDTVAAMAGDFTNVLMVGALALNGANALVSGAAMKWGGKTTTITAESKTTVNKPIEEVPA